MHTDDHLTLCASVTPLFLSARFAEIPLIPTLLLNAGADPDVGTGARGGRLDIMLDRATRTLDPGGYAYLPPRAPWTVSNTGVEPARFHWIRKRYERVEGLKAPDPVFENEQDILPTPMPDTDGRRATTRFVDPNDLRHDMHVNIVTFEPGGPIPFEETHVMEHGIYALEGKAVYKLNSDWVEIEAGDFMWLRAICPQACDAGGPGRFPYLLYKDVNRHARLSGPGPVE